MGKGNKRKPAKITSRELEVELSCCVKKQDISMPSLGLVVEYVFHLQLHPLHLRDLFDDEQCLDY